MSNEVLVSPEVYAGLDYLTNNPRRTVPLSNVGESAAILRMARYNRAADWLVANTDKFMLGLRKGFTYEGK